MKKLIGLALVVVVLLWIALVIANKEEKQPTPVTTFLNTSTPSNRTPITAPTPAIDDVEKNARGVVGFDDGGIAPSPDDVRVKRARFLLTDIAERTGSTTLQVAAVADFSVKQLREKYGLEVKRLEFLEKCRDLEPTLYKLNKNRKVDLAFLAASVATAYSMK